MPKTPNANPELLEAIQDLIDAVNAVKAWDEEFGYGSDDEGFNRLIDAFSCVEVVEKRLKSLQGDCPR